MSPFTTIRRSHKHCSFTLVSVDNTILVLPEGSWTSTCLDDYQRQIIQLRQQTISSGFACMVSTRKWELSSPVILEKLAAFNTFAVQSGMEAQWLVGSESRIAHQRITEKYLRPTAPFIGVTESLDEAIEECSLAGFLQQKEAVRQAFGQAGQLT